MKAEAYNDIVAARKKIFQQILKVEDGTYSLEKGIVLHKLNTDLMEGYRIQAKVFEITANTSHTPVTVAETTRQLK